MFRPLEIWKSQSMAHIYVRCTNVCKKTCEKNKTKVSTYCLLFISVQCWHHIAGQITRQRECLLTFEFAVFILSHSFSCYICFSWCTELRGLMIKTKNHEILWIPIFMVEQNIVFSLVMGIGNIFKIDDRYTNIDR